MPVHAFSKSIVLNLICLAVATAACAAVTGVAATSACLFVFVLLLLCNEVWHWALVGPALISAIVGAVRGRRDTSVPTRGEVRMVRVSALLLLVVPHVIFGLLWGADALLGGAVADGLELPLTHAFFACSFMAPGMLGLIGLFTPLCPLSVEVMFGRLFEPEDERSTPRSTGDKGPRGAA